MSQTRRTEEQMFPLIERYLQGTLTQKAFCAEHGLSLAQLRYWRAKYRKEAQDKPEAFIEIVAEQPQECPLLEVVYPHGVRLRVFSPVEPTYLARLLALEDR